MFHWLNRQCGLTFVLPVRVSWSLLCESIVAHQSPKDYIYSRERWNQTNQITPTSRRSRQSRECSWWEETYPILWLWILRTLPQTNFEEQYRWSSFITHDKENSCSWTTRDSLRASSSTVIEKMATLASSQRILCTFPLQS